MSKELLCVTLVVLTALCLCARSAGQHVKEREELEDVPPSEGGGEVHDLEPPVGLSKPPPPPPPSPPSTASSSSTPVKTEQGRMRSGKYVSDMDTDYTNYDCLKTRRAPPSSLMQNGGEEYIITEARLKKIRSEFLYCFFDQGGDDGNGDYQKDIHSSTPTIHKNFNFQLPFFGFRFNYTRLSMHGYLEFSDPPEHYTYPLSFPNKDWPEKNDPSFIGIFFSKMRIGKIYPEDIDQRLPGVYFRMERDLQTRKDQFGVEMRERLKWDIRQGVVGSDSFYPKHAVVVTWKNMSFAGGIDNTLYKTNTFQMVLATDEVYTYAIFNYVDIQWLSHTEAGGDTTTGSGGTPAYVGFNAGNGTQNYEYTPYSQASTVRDLTGRGWGNGFPGRHIFRIDEKIMLGSCNKDIAGTNLPLTFAPESGNMLGGTVVNITGPCFEKNEKIRCRFDTEDVEGIYVDTNRAICVQPMVYAEGYIVLEVSTGDKGYNWRGKYFIETPATAAQKIIFQSEDDIHLKSPAEIKFTWNSYNLTSNSNAGIRISLWGYRETTIRPELLYIDMIEDSTTNTGVYTIAPGNYRNRDNRAVSDCQFGFIQINLTQPETYQGLSVSPVLWSRPIPLAWYFGPQWERQYGSRWPEEMCNNWIMNDRYLKNFAAEIPQCPCSLEHALNDKGRYMPDFDCDKDTNRKCYYHKTAVHCVKTGVPSQEGSEQECCYDKTNYLMLSYDQQWGSRPHRSHNLGFLPWNEANKVPTLSHWFHDMIPFYQCCLWQEEQAVGCETYRFERRPSQDCVAYQAPYVATVFGDPHIITFDGFEYTFNGKGEFVLLHADTAKAKLDVQARFEQVPENRYGKVPATLLTAIAARGNMSSTIEVRIRPSHAQWRYRLDVIADKKRVYFDRPSLKIQHFRGVTVYTPTNVLDQSQVVIMFQSGAGVEVVENKGYMTARVYLPWSFINQTRGLFGNWSFDLMDELTLPNGQKVVPDLNINNFESIHKSFGLYWMLEDRENPDIGSALFSREYMRTASYYGNRTFVAEWKKYATEIVPYNRTSREKELQDGVSYCGDSYQCRFDYAVSLNRELAFYSKQHQDDYSKIRKKNLERVISCGVLETPRFGRKSNFYFIPGKKVTFECNQGFVLDGDQRRTCNPDGRWSTPENGFTECLRQQEYSSRQIGIIFGIILGVLVPLILIIIALSYFLSPCQQEYSSRQIGIIFGIILGVLVPLILIIIAVWFWFVKKNRTGESSTLSWNYKTPRTSNPPEFKTKPQGDFDNDSSLSGAFMPKTKGRPSSNSSIFGGKGRRSYDAVYRTNEPLPGKPDIDFEDKVWDLEEEASTLSDMSPSDTSQGPVSNRLRQQEKSSREAGITSGIILGVLVPILLIIVCVVYKNVNARRKRLQRESDDSPVATKRKQPVELTGASIRPLDSFSGETVTLQKKETELN